MAGVPAGHTGKVQVMARAVVFKSASGINCGMGREPSPVRALEPNVAFYTGVLGFTLARREQQSAALIQGARRNAPPPRKVHTSAACESLHIFSRCRAGYLPMQKRLKMRSSRSLV